MTEVFQRLRKFVSELRRRNVYRVAATYLAVAFVGFQAVKLLIPSTTLPTWSDELILAFLIVGFPVSLVVAWAFEMTADGLRQTPSAGAAVAGEDTPEDRQARASRPVGGEEPTEDESGIAVLPFEDMSPEGDQEYFGDGLAEELLDALTKIEGLRVVARTSSFAFRDESATVQQIGDQLDVSHLLEGSVRKSGDRLRVTAQLVNASDGYHLWSDTYDRTASDVFEIQDEIARSVVDSLQGILLVGNGTSESRGAPRVESGTEDPEAHDLYLQGKYYWHHRSRYGLEAAIERFREAIDADPEFARPFAGLAVAYVAIAVYRLQPPDELRPPTREAIDRALELEPDLAEAWHSEGFYRAFFDAAWEDAVSAFRRAAELDPDSGVYASWIGFLGLHLPEPPGDVSEQLSRAEELEPRSYYVVGVLALSALLDRRYDDAVEFADRALEIEPKAFHAWLAKGVGHTHRGDGEAGLEGLDRMVELVGRTPFGLTILGSVAARVGYPERTRSILRELEARSEEDFVAPVQTGMLKAALGRVDEALQDLEAERAEYGAGSFTHLLLNIWPELEADRRYRNLMEDVGLRVPSPH